MIFFCAVSVIFDKGLLTKRRALRNMLLIGMYDAQASPVYIDRHIYFHIRNHKCALFSYAPTPMELQYM